MIIRRNDPRRRTRRGIALMDVIVGGVILGIGVSAILSVTTRALARQTDGEKRLVAAWLADDVLNMVLVEGPIRYPKLYDSKGKFDPPFDEYLFDVDVEDLGASMPLRVTARISWPARLLLAGVGLANGPGIQQQPRPQRACCRETASARGVRGCSDVRRRCRGR